MVHYYQQVGRAGRGIDRAVGVLLGGGDDQDINEFFIRTAFPPEALVAKILTALGASEDGLSVEDLGMRLNLSRSEVQKVLKLLQATPQAPVAARIEDGRKVWFLTLVKYRPDTGKIEALARIRRGEWQRMQDYLQSRACLMQFLASELDDPLATPCGSCAVCLGRPIVPTNVSPTVVAQAISFLGRSERAIPPKQQWQADALKEYGWEGSIDVKLRAEEGRVLCAWGDEGWGQMVRQGKETGSFDPLLIPPLVSLVRERWRPCPMPTWVTCVPSLNRRMLVPELARRLAAALGLPFVPVVRKTRPTAPQKEQRNSYQQAKNLDGAFAVDRWPGLAGPVLLVDDMIDSGWTFTVVAALLRAQGSGSVYPLALASTSPAEDA